MVYAAAPADNPLKGFMPYAGSYAFAHSLEWFYIPWSALQTDYSTFSWAELDRRLSEIAARGHQAVFRVYLDYPGSAYGVPAFLSHVPKQAYSGSGPSFSPDYANADLQRALLNFITAFGARYDGDPRVGFITAGLLGFWGEWHTYPYNWMASPAFMNQVLDAYERAFPRTLILAREPKSGVRMDRPRLGFHDDSFAYSTIGSTSWHFWPSLQAAGLAQVWQTRPIGGEVRPEVQSCVWNTPTCTPAGQDFGLSVATTHASWMLNNYVFSNSLNAEQQARATEGARSMGYILHAPTAKLEPVLATGVLRGSVTVENRGVAPFYYPWTVRLGVLDGQGRLRSWPMTWDLRAALPNTPTTWGFELAGHGLAAGSYTLLVGVPNPLAGGRPLRFANSAQDQNIDGWLSLGQFTIRP